MKQLALQTVYRLREAGFVALWAGGCVRDMLLGSMPHDYDVATDAAPEQVRKLFRRTLAVGAQFGVIEVLGDLPQVHVQVATFRSDGNYSDGRHPDSVRFGSPQEDALRRDFTINGLFYDPVTDEVIDFVEGQSDLQRRLVRAIGDPSHRFAEDKLRMLRAIRFVSRFGFHMDDNTAHAIESMHAQIKQVSAERITDELKKLLIHGERLKALHFLTELRLLPTLLPELAWPSEITKERPIAFLLSASLPKDVNFPLAWAAMLLDLHRELRSASPISIHELHVEYGNRFRLSSADISHIAYLVLSLEKLSKAQQMPWAKLKPLLAHPHCNDLLTLLEVATKSLGWPRFGLDYCKERLASWTLHDLQPPCLVTGEDIANLGLKPGPVFKQLLEEVRSAQLNEQVTSREEALLLLTKLVSTIHE